MVAEYRREKSENYMKLIQNIGGILTETKLLGDSLDAYLTNYYERLKNS